MTQVGARVCFERRAMKGNRLLVIPQETARKLDLASDFAANQAVTTHTEIVGHPRRRS
jgi:hypothetical protein